SVDWPQKKRPACDDRTARMSSMRRGIVTSGLHPFAARHARRVNLDVLGGGSMLRRIRTATLSGVSNALGAPLTAFAVASATLIAGCGKDEAVRPAACSAPTPPEEATRKMGWNGSTYVLPGGRVLTPSGTHQEVGGFPLDVRAHPNLPIAYVANA